MKDKNDEDFNRIKEFLEKRKFNLDNPDFEEIVMSKIALEKNYETRVRSYIKWSIGCFVGGLVLCIALVLWLLFKNDSIDISYEVTSILCLFSLGVIGVLFIDNFLKLLNNYKTLN